MVQHKFNNEYDTILCALSILQDRFERDVQLFAPPCIWWLASIFQFTEILIYYRHYNLFPPEYVNSLRASPVSNPGIADSIIPQSEISMLDINDSDTQVHSGGSDLLPNYRGKKQCLIHTTRSRNIFKNKPNYSNSEL